MRLLPRALIALWSAPPSGAAVQEQPAVGVVRPLRDYLDVSGPYPRPALVVSGRPLLPAVMRQAVVTVMLD
jgi:hypothetical protein